MKAMVCEMCQSNDLVKQDGIYVCQHCGTKYSVEEARKLLVDGVVKVDTTDNLKNYYELARRAKNNGNSDDGAKYYDLIRQIDPNSWEANFYSVYFTSMNCIIAHISSAATSLANCIGSVLSLIKENSESDEAVKEAVDEIYERANDAADKFVLASCNTYLSINEEYRAQYVKEFSERVISAVSINTEMAENLKRVFGDEEAWVLQMISSEYSEATSHMRKYVRDLKPVFFLNKAQIHTMMEEQASLVIAEYEVLHEMFSKKAKDKKLANIEKIDDINERFKVLMEEDMDKAVDLYDSITLSKEEQKCLVDSDDYLACAVMTQNLRQVKMLLKMGADVNGKNILDRDMIYCLTILADQNSNINDSVQILNILLDAGAVPKDGDYNDRTNPALKDIILEKYPGLKPDTLTNAVNGGGCYVATAVYGSYDCPEVWTLRRFRDYTLAETWYGRAFIRTYYAVSPTLVKWFGKTEWFKNIWKPTLDRMVEKLNKTGVADTPYNDREW